VAAAVVNNASITIKHKTAERSFIFLMEKWLKFGRNLFMIYKVGIEAG